MPHSASIIAQRLKNKSGFSLIELAIVLVVIGIIIGLGTSLIGPLTKRVKFNESREIVKAAREAVIGFAITNKQLPATLAAAGARDVDAWGNQLDYITNMPGVNLCTSAPTYLASVTDNRSNPHVTLTNSVVVLLLSRGENRINDTGSGPSYTIKEYGDSDYDDLVEYVDLAFLREKVCHALKITTDSLPIGKEETLYPLSTTLEATDGTIPYTWSIVGQTPGTNGCAAGEYPIASASTGLCLTAAGVISGTPTVSGSFNFAVQVQDNEARVAQKRLAITINPNPPAITTEFLNYGQVGLSYSVTIGASGGGAAYAWCKVSGTYPPGMTTMPPDCPATVTGTPSTTISGNPSASGTYSLTLQVADNRGRTASKNLSIAINP